MEKYRLVEKQDPRSNNGNPFWIIEKQKSFLWWTWWTHMIHKELYSTNYFTDKNKAETFFDSVISGEKYKSKVIKQN